MKTVNYMSGIAEAPMSFRFRPSDFDRRPAHDDGIIRCEARRTQATWNDGTRQLVTGKEPRRGTCASSEQRSARSIPRHTILAVLAKTGRTRLFRSRLVQRESFLKLE